MTLDNDSGEKLNILDIQPEVTTKLRAKLTDHMDFEQSNTISYEEEWIRRRARKLKT